MVLMIVSGRSGSGKSVALRALECYPIWLEPWPIASLRIPKVLRMKRSYSVMSLLDVVRRNSTWY